MITYRLLQGLHNFLLDLRSMFGAPQHRLGRWFGRSGLYIQLIWRFFSPLAWIVSATNVRCVT